MLSDADARRCVALRRVLRVEGREIGDDELAAGLALLVGWGMEMAGFARWGAVWVGGHGGGIPRDEGWENFSRICG